MQHTSAFSVVATTDTIRDLLGLCGPVVSAYVPRDETERLIQWLSRPLPTHATRQPSAHGPVFDVLSPSSASRHDERLFSAARERMRSALTSESAPSAAYTPGARSASGLPPHDSLAAFATPDAVHLVPIPFPVEYALSVGATPKLSPLLRVFGPEYAVGLRLHDRGADVTTTVPSAQESAPERTVRYTLDVAADPPLACSSPSTLSGMRPLIQWLRAVDDELSAFLPRRDQPVVLLGDRSLCDAFATLNLHRTLLRTTSSECSETGTTTSEHIGRSIRERADGYRQAQADADLRLLRDLYAFQPDRFCAEDHIIAAEAASRRIETLFVDEALLCSRKRKETGAHHADGVSGDGSLTDVAPTLAVRTPTGLSSRIDRTVAETIVAGGTVHTVRSTSLPLGHHIAAIFRY